MTVQRLEHIGVVVDDLEAANAFFVALGLEVEGETSVEGHLVDRINGLDGVRADIVILRTPDGGSTLELAKYRSPVTRGRRRGRRRPTPRASATSCSSSTTSRRPSPPCRRMAASSSASWSTTRTSSGSATCAARRGSSSSWRRRSADAAGSCTVTQSPPAARGVRVRVPSCASGDALDDRQAEADARVVGAHALGAALERLGERGDQLRGERLAGVLDGEHHALGVSAGRDPHGARARAGCGRSRCARGSWSSAAGARVSRWWGPRRRRSRW